MVVLIALVALIGWRVYDRMQNKQTAGNTETASQQTPEVKNNGDLQKAEDFVTNTDIDKSLDTSEIDTALSE